MQAWENHAVTIANVLADRYASPQVRQIWSPEHKVAAERRLWIAVLKAQAELGVDVPDGVVEAYERVVDDIDLASIAARERRTRHDVKARIEEFCAQAGHEHIHKGMTSRDLTENVEQLQIRDSLVLVRTKVVATIIRLGELAAQHRTLVLAGRSHNVAAQATTLGKRFATIAEEMLFALARLDELIARYPLRGIKGPVGTAQDQLDLLDGDPAKLADLEQRVAEHLGFADVLTSVGQVYPRSLDFDVVSALGAGGSRAEQPGHHDQADGRHRARHRGLPAGPGRFERDAAQDEHPFVRARQRPRRDPARPPVDGRRAGRRPVERRRRVLLGRTPGRAARCVLRRSTGCSRRS